MRHLDKVPRALDALGQFRHARQVRREAYEFVSGQTGPRRLRHRPRKCENPRRLRPAHVGPVDAVGPAPRRGGRDVRHACIWAAGTITGICSQGWRRTCRSSTRSVTALCCRSDGARPARFDAGHVVRRVQPHAANEQRRQRRPAAAAWARPAATTGATRCSASWAAAASAAARSSARPTPKATARSPARSDRKTSTPPSTSCLGIDPALKLLDHTGRPTPILNDPTPIAELIYAAPLTEFRNKKLPRDSGRVSYRQAQEIRAVPRPTFAVPRSNRLTGCERG